MAMMEDYNRCCIESDKRIKELEAEDILRHFGSKEVIEFVEYMIAFAEASIKVNDELLVDKTEVKLLDRKLILLKEWRDKIKLAQDYFKGD